uniref:Uncharacterized protein n=1 Tax=Glossina austeni TaxID=7395 RepID=A0A1A9UXT1_GLOAU
MEEKMICDKLWAGGSASDILQEISDQSFKALEVMCNKTSSDPSSAVFQYLYPDGKENLLAKVKGRVVNDKAETPLGLGITQKLEQTSVLTDKYMLLHFLLSMGSGEVFPLIRLACSQLLLQCQLHFVNVSKQSASILHMETPTLVTVHKFNRPLQTLNKITMTPAEKNLDNSNVKAFAKEEETPNLFYQQM